MSDMNAMFGAGSDLGGFGGDGFSAYGGDDDLLSGSPMLDNPQDKMRLPMNTWTYAAPFVPFQDYVPLVDGAKQMLHPHEAVVLNIPVSNLAEGATTLNEWVPEVRNNANQACPESTRHITYIKRLLNTLVACGQFCAAVSPEGTAEVGADAGADGQADGASVQGGAFAAAAAARVVSRRGAENAAESDGPRDWCPPIVDTFTECSSPSLGYVLEMLMMEPAANAKPSQVLGFRVWLFNFNVNVSLDDAFVRAIRNAAASEQDDKKKKAKSSQGGPQAAPHMERGPLQNLKELYWAYTSYVRQHSKCSFLFRNDNSAYRGTAPGEGDVYPGQLHNALLWVKGKDHPFAITRRLNPLTDHALGFGLDDPSGNPLKIWSPQLQRETYFEDTQSLEWAPLERQPDLEPLLWGFNDLFNGKLLSAEARLPPMPAASGNVPSTVRECFREFALRELNLPYMRTVNCDHPVVLQACTAYCRNEALPASVFDYKKGCELARVHNGPGPYEAQSARNEGPSIDLSVKPRQQAYAMTSKLVCVLNQQCEYETENCREKEADLLKKSAAAVELFEVCLKEKASVDTRYVHLLRNLQTLLPRLQQLTLSKDSGFTEEANTAIDAFNLNTKKLLVLAQKYCERVENETCVGLGAGPAIKSALELYRSWVRHPRAQFARARKDLQLWSIAHLTAVMRARESELPKAMVKRTAAAWSCLQENQRQLLSQTGDAQRPPSENVFRAERPLSLFGDMMQFLTDFSREVLQIWEKPTMFLMFFVRQFEPLIPDAKWRWRIFGPPGCGKSHFIGHMKVVSLSGTVSTNVSGSEHSDVQGAPEESGGCAFTDEEQAFSSVAQANVMKSIITERTAGRKRAYKDIDANGRERFATHLDVAEHEELLGELCNSDPLSDLNFNNPDASKDKQGSEHKSSWRDRHIYSFWRGVSSEQQARCSPQPLEERIAAPQYAEMVARYKTLCSLVTIAMPYCSLPGLDVDTRPFYDLSNELQTAARGFFEVPGMRTRQLHAQKMLYRVLTVSWAMWTRAMFTPPDPATWVIAPLRSWSDVTVENLLIPVAELLRVSSVEVGCFSYWLERYFSTMGPLYDQVLFSLIEVMGIAENATMFGLPAQEGNGAQVAGTSEQPKSLGTAAFQWKRMHLLARNVLAAALESWSVDSKNDRKDHCNCFMELGKSPSARAAAFCEKAASKGDKGFSTWQVTVLSTALASTPLFRNYKHDDDEVVRVPRSTAAFVEHAQKLMRAAGYKQDEVAASQALLQRWRALYSDTSSATGALSQLLDGGVFDLPVEEFKNEQARGPSGAPLKTTQVWPFDAGFKQLGSVLDKQSISKMADDWERFMRARATRRANPNAPLSQEQADMLTPPPAVLASIYDPKTVGDSLLRAHTFVSDGDTSNSDVPRSRYEDLSKTIHFHSFTHDGRSKWDFTRMMHRDISSWADLADAALKTSALRKLRIPAEFVRGAFMLFQQTVIVTRLQRRVCNAAPANDSSMQCSVQSDETSPVYKAFAERATLETLERLEQTGGCNHTFMATHMAMQKHMFPALAIDTEGDRHVNAPPFEIALLRKAKKDDAGAETKAQFALSVSTDFLIYLIEFRNYMRMSMRSEPGVERHVEPEFMGATTTFDSYSHEGSSLPLGWDLPFLCKIKYVMNQVVWRRQAFRATVRLTGADSTEQHLLQPCCMVSPVCTLAPGRSELYLIDMSVSADADPQNCVPPVVRARVESCKAIEGPDALREAIEGVEASKMAETTFRVLTGRNPAPGELEKMNETGNLMSAIRFNTVSSVRKVEGAAGSVAVKAGLHLADPFHVTALKVLDCCLALEPSVMVAGPDARENGSGVRGLQSQAQLLEEVVSTCNVRLQNLQSAAEPLSRDEAEGAARFARAARKAREAHVDAALSIQLNRAADGDMGLQCFSTLRNLANSRMKAGAYDMPDVDGELDFLNPAPGAAGPSGVEREPEQCDVDQEGAAEEESFDDATWS
jgi:hypothetical protein